MSLRPPRGPGRFPAALALLLLAMAPALARGEGAAPRRAARPARAMPATPPAPPRAPARVKARARVSGIATVLSVAAGRAYLDAGTLDGLAPGRSLRLRRAGAPAGTCTVEAASDHASSCTGTDVKPGDSTALAAAAPAPAPPPPLPPLLTASEQARRRAALATAPVATVEFTPGPRPGAAAAPHGVEASLVHASFFTAGASGLAEERLEARIRGAELAPGWRLFADASAVARPNAVSERFRTGESAWVEVRELSASSREPGRAFALSIGRVLPWSAPGSTPFDGAQVGWRSGGTELGIFGGAVPDVLTTGLTTSRATAGAYGALESSGASTMLRGEGRLAMVRSPELGTRLEAEASGHAWLSRSIDLSGGARLGLMGDRTAPGALDAARLELSARLAPPLFVTGSLRYQGLSVLGSGDLGAPALFPNPARHAEASAGWDLSPALTLRAIGGYAKDLTTGLDRGYGGPELALPRLFGRRGGASAGWFEERGWAGGRSLWLQAQGDAAWGLRLLSRASFFMDTRPAPVASDVTLGLLASASKDLAPWLRFRLSGLTRVGLASSGAAEKGLGLSLLAALDGSY